MSIEPHRPPIHDEVMMSALVGAAAGLLDDLVDRLLRTDERVASAAEGKRLIAADDDMEDVADRVQRFVAIATPTVRMLARGARFTRVPWVLVASTAVSLTTTVRAGVLEVRVIGSLLAYRLEKATGAQADPALVKKLAIELYLAPRREPDVGTLDLPLAQLVRKWLLRGVFGRNTRKAAERALEAAERLDLKRVLVERREAD
ncbi:MAG TPA: hypothetical protein VGF10_09435 [Gaiella sp.]